MSENPFRELERKAWTLDTQATICRACLDDYAPVNYFKHSSSDCFFRMNLVKCLECGPSRFYEGHSAGKRECRLVREVWPENKAERAVAKRITISKEVFDDAVAAGMWNSFTTKNPLERKYRFPHFYSDPPMEKLVCISIAGKSRACGCRNCEAP